MAKLNLTVEDDLHKKAKIISAKTGLTLSEVFELLLGGLSESDILTMASKKKKEKS